MSSCNHGNKQYVIGICNGDGRYRQLFVCEEEHSGALLTTEVTEAVYANINIKMLM